MSTCSKRLAEKAETSAARGIMTNAAVLTISDSVSAGGRADRSGPAVRDRLAGRSAEFKAANDLLHQGSKLENLVFTPAVHPWPERRTGNRANLANVPQTLVAILVLTPALRSRSE